MIKSREKKMEYGTVSLPMPLIRKIKDKIEGTGMNSVSAYVSFILRQVLSSPTPASEIVDEEEQKNIKKRLKSLGYI
jgi:hypothetical protein